MVTPNMGLREKKRLETRARLENAAIQLVSRDGFEKVTIEMISEAADVSTRTFFNYFDSKEEAILGLHKSENKAQVETSAPDDSPTDIVAHIVGILINDLAPSVMDSSLHKSRGKLVRSYPKLLDRQITHMTQKKEQLTSIVEEFMIRTEPTRKDDSDNALRAEVIVMACIGGVKAATKEWIETKKDPSLHTLNQRATTLIQEAIRIL